MDAAVELVVTGLRLVPRVGPASRGGVAPGDRVGQRAAVGPRAPRRRLDHHHTHVALGAEGEELFGRLAVLGPGPQRGIDREHHGVEVETAECLEVGARHLHVVPGDPGEPGVAGVTQRQDPLQRRRAPVELVERGHRVGLVEVQHVGMEQAAGRVELVGDAVRVGPQRLPRDEQFLAMSRQVRADHRLGCAVLRRDVEVVHPVVEGQLQPLPRLVDGGGPTGGTAQHRHAALVAGPSQASALHVGSYPLSCRTLKTAPTLSARTANRPGSMSVGPMNTLAPSSCAFATVASVSATAK